MPSYIYSDNLKNPEVGDLRQWHLFSKFPGINISNIGSLFSVFAMKIFLFIINSIVYYSKRAITLKDSRFLLTSINHNSIFFP